MARTTIAIEDALLRQVKQRAARKGATLQAEVNALLRQALAAPPRPGYELKLATWAGEQAPGVDLFDRNSLFEWMERG
jgi:plasmid stability protein